MRPRFLPAPLLSAVLFGAWLLLNGLSAGHVALAAALGIAIPWFTEPFRPDRFRVRSWTTVAALTATVLWDIVVSNVQVARLIIGPERLIHPRFVWLPLDIRDPHGIATLAGIITMTPGTLSADLTDDRRHLLVHALNVDDEAELIASIKTRYEAPLQRIFEGNT
ncbi:MAG: Na+/H+ antiporter subunit E [Betaproteobacteria bacterium]